MNDKPFSNREITSMFQSILEKLDAHTDVHTSILSAVQTTNGKVADIQTWRERMNGGMTVTGIFLTVVIVPILTWAVWSILNIQFSIQETVKKAVDTYEENHQL